MHQRRGGAPTLFQIVHGVAWRFSLVMKPVIIKSVAAIMLVILLVEIRGPDARGTWRAAARPNNESRSPRGRPT